MKRLGCVFLFLVFVPLAKPQASKDAISELQRSMPSEREFSELLAKADEKVSAFEAAIQGESIAIHGWPGKSSSLRLSLPLNLQQERVKQVFLSSSLIAFVANTPKVSS